MMMGGFNNTYNNEGIYCLAFYTITDGKKRALVLNNKFILPYLLDKKGESVRVCRPTFFPVKYLLKLINSNSESYSKQYRNII